MPMKQLLIALTSLLAVSCGSPGQDQAPPASAATPGCDPTVRLEPKVAVMYRNEWMSGPLAITVCRGSLAATGDVTPFVQWLGERAKVGEIRRCGTPSAKEPLTERERREAESHLSGVKDWCLQVTADI